MKDIFYNILSFLKAPCLLESHSPIKPKAFFALFVITLVINIPYALLLDLAGIDQFDNIFEQMLKENKWLVTILGIFIAPILEEPIFRLHLDLKKSSI